MNSDRFTASETVDHETVQSVGKVLLATLALIWLLYLVSILPGIDRLVPGTSVTFAAIALAIATVMIVGLLLYLAPTLANLVRTTITGPQQVIDDIASIVHLFIVLVAVLVAHRGLEPAIVGLFGGVAGADAGWLYDLLFFALAVPPLAILAARVYVSLDPMADLLADRLTSLGDESSQPSSRAESSGEAAGSSTAGESSVTDAADDDSSEPDET